MPKWQNWSGLIEAKPSRYRQVYSAQEAAGLAKTASQTGQIIRAVGSGHSHQDLVGNDDTIVDLIGLAGVGKIDTAEKTAWIFAGSKIHTLGAALCTAGLALANQGDIDQQTLAGATATGTHGTGLKLRNLSSQVVGVELATSDGEVIECSADSSDPFLRNLWRASRLHLGAFGIVTKIKMQLIESYKLAETGWQATLDETLEQFEKLCLEHRHCEFFWFPQTDKAQVKCIDETQAEPRYPLAEEGSRVGWNYEVLPNHRPVKHSEMEYSVPFERAIDCMKDIQSLLDKDFRQIKWPVEFRAQGADDVALSPAFGKDVVTISVHQGAEEEDEPYFRACEEIFLSYDGKPHWGKVNYLTGEQMESLHEGWDSWWEVRNAIDPSKTFLNYYLRSLSD